MPIEVQTGSVGRFKTAIRQLIHHTFKIDCTPAGNSAGVLFTSGGVSAGDLTFTSSNRTTDEYSI